MTTGSSFAIPKGYKVTLRLAKDSFIIFGQVEATFSPQLNLPEIFDHI